MLLTGEVPLPTGTHGGQAPQFWRAPEGPEGTGGLRDAAPSEARLPSLAGGRGLRRLENPWSQEQHATSCGPPPTGTHSGQVGRGGPCGMHSAQVRRGGP